MRNILVLLADEGKQPHDRSAIRHRYLSRQGRSSNHLKKHGSRLQDSWDGLISESRRKEPGIPLEKVKADLLKSGRLRE